MDLSNFVTYVKKESLLLIIAKSILDIVGNTLSKPQETLEFEMNKQKESFSFDIPLELPEKWMTRVTSLEVYNTVYNKLEKKNKLEIQFTRQQLKSLNVDTELQENVYDYSIKINQAKTLASYNEFLEKINKSINKSYSKKLTRSDLNRITRKIQDVQQDAKLLNLDFEGASRKHQLNTINIPEFEIVHDHFRIELLPGVYELVDINRII